MRLVVVSGPPCSGKSTLAREIGQSLDFTVLDVDEVRRLVLPRSQQAVQDRNIAYRCMHFTVAKMVEAGLRRAVLAATYARREPREWLSSMASEIKASVHVIGCRVNAETAAARFRQRGPGHPAVDLDEARVRFLAMEHDYFGVEVVETDAPIEQCIRQALTYLSIGPPVDLTAWARGRAREESQD